MEIKTPLPEATLAATSQQLARLRTVLQQHSDLPDSASVQTLFTLLVQSGLADLPAPGAGQTLARWQMLAEVAAHDLALVKLFEGHTDAIAALHEVSEGAFKPPADSLWGLWAAEAPGSRVVFETSADADGATGAIVLQGKKAWCSGAQTVTHGLLTVWPTANAAEPSAGPYLAAVALNQPGVQTSIQGWHAVGMAYSASGHVTFESASAVLVGQAGAYLRRPGFWQGGAGVAACWYGGAAMLGRALHQAVSTSTASNPFREAALGKVDLALLSTAALLREAAAWIDANPGTDASVWAWRTRLAAETTARTVLDEVGRALGATPFCRNPRFARMAADLPVFVRQSHAERDFAALGAQLALIPKRLDTQSVWAL